MSSKPDVDVVIITWNDGELLDVAVQSVRDSVGVWPRLTVVDNGSEPPAKVLHGDLEVSEIRNPQNRGVAAARNQGAGIGAAPWVCFLDSDARLHPSCLALLVKALEESERRAIAVPRFAGQPIEASAGRAPNLRDKVLRAVGRTSVYRRKSQVHARIVEVDFGIGACLCVRRTAFAQAGGFDEHFFYGPEDVDLCLRIKGVGHEVVQVLDAECDHPPRRRNRRILTTRGMRHGFAVLHYQWRHRKQIGWLS